MSLMQEARARAKSAFRGGVPWKRKPADRVVVVNITRVSPASRLAEIEYHYGRVSWPERVIFTRHRTDTHDLVTVTDADYPDDRKRAFVIPRGSDMTAVILDYLKKGRW